MPTPRCWCRDSAVNMQVPPSMIDQGISSWVREPDVVSLLIYTSKELTPLELGSARTKRPSPPIFNIVIA